MPSIAGSGGSGAGRVQTVRKTLPGLDGIFRQNMNFLFATFVKIATPMHEVRSDEPP